MASEFSLIRRTSTIEEADILTAWLEEQGIEAMIIDRANSGAYLFGLTDLEGFAIVAAEAAVAERAVKLLEEHNPPTKKRGAGTKVAAKCEDCGKDTVFDGAMQGTVQECEHCGAYVDVPESAG